MGFALVVEMIAKSRKPLIGHNCTYDWLYMFTQFCDKLPDTFYEFTVKWHELFPHTLDTKVLAFHSKAFYNTGLGALYEKVTTDEKFKNNLRFRFDTFHNFTRYDGSNILQYYHEAAYDAHMTGVVFAHILKHQEAEELKYKQKQQDFKGEKPKFKHQPIKFGNYYDKWENKMMMDSFGSGRFYQFVPEKHLEQLQRN